MDTNLDPKVKNLVSAIGRAETGNPTPQSYTQRGASGEFGRYQFMPDTYKAYAKKYLGDENAQPTVENQNKIAYSFVKEKKDAGFNPAQIASMWNAGEGRPNAYKENFRGVNAQGVAYDTPAYAAKVSQYYNQLNSQIPQTPDIQQQRENLQAQGQPVSLDESRAKPTFGGEIVRGLIKTPARLLTNEIQAAQLLTGSPVTQPFSGKYLGEVKPIGQEGSFGKRLKETAGAGLELGSYAVGGGEAKAGLEAAKAGGLFTKGLLKTLGKGALEGAGIGALGGAGQALGENKDIGSTVKSTLGGALVGGVTGGVLGTVGGLIAKAKGITPETIDAVKSSIGSDYVKSLSKTVAGRKVLDENAIGLKASLDAGILPDINNNRYDTTLATKKLQDMMDKLGAGRGADIAAQNKPVDNTLLKNSIVNNINEFVADPLEKQKVLKNVDDWFAALGDKPIDLEKLNKLQVSAGKLARFENNSDATIRSAYRNIYHGIGTFINENVKSTGGVNQEINNTLTQYHKIMDFLDAIHEKPVSDKGLVSILASHAAKTAATGVGATLGGPAGAIIGAESLPVFERMLRKILGGDNTSYTKVMEAIQSGEQKRIDTILKQVEKNKGLKAVRDIQRALQEVKQLPAGTLPKGKISETYTPIKLGGATTFEKPAEKVTKKVFNPKNKKYYTKGLLGGGNP